MVQSILGEFWVAQTFGRTEVNDQKSDQNGVLPLQQKQVAKCLCAKII